MVWSFPNAEPKKYCTSFQSHNFSYLWLQIHYKCWCFYSSMLIIDGRNITPGKLINWKFGTSIFSVHTFFSPFSLKYYTFQVKLLIVFCNNFNVSQPRILMAMARDGLLPPFFSDISKHSQVPVKSTIVTGLVAALLAFFMDVSQLAGMVSLLV